VAHDGCANPRRIFWPVDHHFVDDFVQSAENCRIQILISELSWLAHEVVEWSLSLWIYVGPDDPPDIYLIEPCALSSTTKFFFSSPAYPSLYD
jgi:hypothetical protein